MLLPLFVLSSICLRISKSLSMGELISVTLAWVVLVFGSSFFRSKYALCCDLRLYFSYYTWLWLVQVFIVNFCLMNQVLGENSEVEAQQIQGSSQKRRNWPNMVNPRQKPWSKAKTQNAAFENQGAKVTASTMAWPWYLPWTMVACHCQAVVAPASPAIIFLSVFSISMIISITILESL